MFLGMSIGEISRYEAYARLGTDYWMSASASSPAVARNRTGPSVR